MLSVIPRTIDRVRGAMSLLWREVAKFGIVGAVAFVIDLGGMNLLTHTVLETKVTTAKIISGVAATLFAWAANRTWTFRHRSSRPVHHEVILFFIVNGIALVIATLCLDISHYVLGLQTRLADNISTIIGIGLGTLFRFWAYRTYVFANEDLTADTSPLASAREDDPTSGAGRHDAGRFRRSG